MAEAGLPAQVRELAHRHLHSMAHLDVLLLLAGHAEREWTPAEATDEVQAEADAVAQALRDLDRSGLVARAGQGAYRYAPDRAETRATVEMLADTYRRFPVQLIRAIYERPTDPVQSFADAFRLKGS